MILLLGLLARAAIWEQHLEAIAEFIHPSFVSLFSFYELMHAWTSSSVFPLVSGTNFATKRIVKREHPAYKNKVPGQNDLKYMLLPIIINVIWKVEITMLTNSSYQENSNSLESWKYMKLPKILANSPKSPSFLQFPWRVWERSAMWKLVLEHCLNFPIKHHQQEKEKKNVHKDMQN